MCNLVASLKFGDFQWNIHRKVWRLWIILPKNEQRNIESEREREREWMTQRERGQFLTGMNRKCWLLLLLPWLMIEDYTRKWYFCTKVIIKRERESLLKLNNNTHTRSLIHTQTHLFSFKLPDKLMQWSNIFTHETHSNRQFITIFFGIIHIGSFYIGRRF